MRKLICAEATDFQYSWRWKRSLVVWRVGNCFIDCLWTEMIHARRTPVGTECSTDLQHQSLLAPRRLSHPRRLWCRDPVSLWSLARAECYHLFTYLFLPIDVITTFMRLSAVLCNWWKRQFTQISYWSGPRWLQGHTNWPSAEKVCASLEYTNDRRAVYAGRQRSLLFILLNIIIVHWSTKK